MAPEKTDDPPAPLINDKDEGAVVDEEDDDLDDALAELQRIQSAKRREGKEKNQKNRIQEVLPFPFAPNIRPLGISDLQSAVALENAAFTDPQHRASLEKVGFFLALPTPPLFGTKGKAYDLRIGFTFRLISRTVRISPY